MVCCVLYSLLSLSLPRLRQLLRPIAWRKSGSVQSNAIENDNRTIKLIDMRGLSLQGVEVERLSEGDGKNFPKPGDTVTMVSEMRRNHVLVKNVVIVC